MGNKRLTRKDERGFYHYNCTEKDQEDCLIYENCGECYGTNVLYRLAEFEDKIEKGTLIELPCKVGDMVWVIKNYGFNRYVKESVIITGFNIVPIENNRVYPVDNYGGIYSEIFLTREEAEKRLKELQGGNI